MMAEKADLDKRFHGMKDELIARLQNACAQRDEARAQVCLVWTCKESLCISTPWCTAAVMGLVDCNSQHVLLELTACLTVDVITIIADLRDWGTASKICAISTLMSPSLAGCC